MVGLLGQNRQITSSLLAEIVTSFPALRALEAMTASLTAGAGKQRQSPAYLRLERLRSFLEEWLKGSGDFFRLGLFERRGDAAEQARVNRGVEFRLIDRDSR